MTKKLRGLVLVTALPLLISCTSPTASSPLEAVQRIANLAGYSPSELTYIETTTMINSPHGNLKVDLYQDEQGRKFYFDPNTNTVVEIDGRDLLGRTHSASEVSSFSLAELASRAEDFVKAAVPEFLSQRDSLDYEASQKGDLFFFDWRMSPDPSFFMPPFIQVGLTNTGEMFAYYDTLYLR